MGMSSQSRHLRDQAIFVSLAPVLVVIYLGCLVHLGFLYLKMLLSGSSLSVDRS